MMRRTTVVSCVLGAALLLAACDEQKTETKPVAEPAKSVAAKAKPSAEPAPAKSAEGDTQPAKAQDDSAVPAEIKALALPAGAEKKKDPQLGSDLFSFSMPKGYAFKQKQSSVMMAGTPKAWVAIEGDGASFAYTSHNPSGDDGPGCPSIDDMKAKVKGATMLLDKSFTTELEGNSSIGDEVKIFIFERDGKTGFYATKMFDHGDDATTYCAATGTADDAKDLSATFDRAKTEALAAIFMTLTFSF